jgi:hypothetical protein
MDTGLAPNPFWGWCTLAVCTPNRQGARLSAGDLIAGFLPKDRDYKLLYVMEVEERLHMNDYYKDSRFVAKRPDLRGDWKGRCGDNFYHQRPDGSWIQERNRFHIGPAYLRKDTRRPFVFAGRRFWYYGANALPLPKEFQPLAGGRGIRVGHEPALVMRFRTWMERQPRGIHGMPSDNPDITGLSPTCFVPGN